MSRATATSPASFSYPPTTLRPPCSSPTTSTEAWDELGPHLLHDAVTAAAYRHDAEGVASISRATDVSGLREAGGPYRIFTTDDAVDYMRGGQALPLAPLCGGVPPELAWPYLERAAEAAARAR